jgi:hypothetical protein
VSLQIASSPPYSAAGATNEAVITLYVPEGSYTLNPTISVPDPDGGVSEVQLPSFDVSVMAGERYCVEDCIRIFIEPPICSTNTGFIGWGNAISLCGQTLTNISVTIRPLSDPSIRLGYSERWLLIGATNAMRMPGQVFPEFDGYLPAHPEYYENMVFTVVAKDNLGHVATRSIITHYDFTPPVLNCSNITVTSPDGGGVLVDFIVAATDDRPEPLRGPTCVPPSGSLFAVGTNTVTCTASDLCRNTNTCTFTVIVQPPNHAHVGMHRHLAMRPQRHGTVDEPRWHQQSLHRASRRAAEILPSLSFRRLFRRRREQLQSARLAGA